MHVWRLQYIREATGAEKVAIVGFSQGTAQTFMALSSNPSLADKVACFMALSAAVTVKGATIATKWVP